MILDSCFLIDLLAGDDAAIAKLDEIADEMLVVPTLVFTEVAVGIDPATPEGNRFDDIMDDVTLAPYDAEAARRAVGIQRGLAGDGDAIGAIDAIIAGIALARDEPVLTRNTAEFVRTPATISPY